MEGVFAQLNPIMEKSSERDTEAGSGRGVCSTTLITSLSLELPVSFPDILKDKNLEIVCVF